MRPIKPEQIDALLPFLKRFEESRFSPGQWKTPERQLPWFRSNTIVLEFVKALYDNDWVTPAFDWKEWKQAAQRYVESPELVESADLVTTPKLLTTHARADRFCEGHLASMFESGHLVALLRRLQVLRSKTTRERNDE